MKKTILINELNKINGVSNYIVYLMNDDQVKINAYLVTGEEEKQSIIKELDKMYFLENK